MSSNDNNTTLNYEEFIKVSPSEQAALINKGYDIRHNIRDYRFDRIENNAFIPTVNGSMNGISGYANNSNSEYYTDKRIENNRITDQNDMMNVFSINTINENT